MLVPGGAGNLGGEKREGTRTSVRFVETMRYCVVCTRVSLTKAGIMSNWLPASKFGGVAESAQDLASYYSQGNDMSRLRHKLAESGVAIQSGCTSPSRLGVMAEPLGDTPSSWTPCQFSMIENVLLAVHFEPVKEP